MLAVVDFEPILTGERCLFNSTTQRRIMVDIYGTPYDMAKRHKLFSNSVIRFNDLGGRSLPLDVRIQRDFALYLLNVLADGRFVARSSIWDDYAK
jgi:hypothetical protein